MTDEQNGSALRVEIDNMKEDLKEQSVRMNNHADRIRNLELTVVGLPSRVGKCEKDIDMNSIKISRFEMRVAIIAGVIAGSVGGGIDLISALIRWAVNGG